MTLLGLFCSGLFGCGRDSPTQLAGPDSVVGFSIKSAQQLPLDGAGSGKEPTINFRWTEVLTATGGGGATVRASRTELHESSSQTVIAYTDLSGFTIQPGAQLERPVVVAGVHAALYPGHWEGRASIDVVHPSGRVQTLQAAFSFE